jgi:hypothetical protein
MVLELSNGLMEIAMSLRCWFWSPFYMRDVVPLRLAAMRMRRSRATRLSASIS